MEICASRSFPPPSEDSPPPSFLNLCQPVDLFSLPLMRRVFLLFLVPSLLVFWRGSSWDPCCSGPISPLDTWWHVGKSSLRGERLYYFHLWPSTLCPEFNFPDPMNPFLGHFAILFFAAFPRTGFLPPGQRRLTFFPFLHQMSLLHAGEVRAPVN